MASATKAAVGEGRNTEVWTKIADLHAHLKQDKDKKSRASAETDGRIATDIRQLEKQLGETIRWDAMPAALAAMRKAIGKVDFSMPDILMGILLIGGWIWLTEVTQSWFWGIALTIGSLYGIHRLIRKLQASGLASSIDVRLLRYVEHQPNSEYPWIFEHLYVTDNGVPDIQNWNLQGISEAPTDGYVLGFFSKDHESLGYLRKDRKKYIAAVFGQGEYQAPDKVVSSDITRLLESEDEIQQRLRDQYQNDKSRSGIDIDMPHLKQSWETVVLAEDVKEHLLRGALLFAFADKAAPRGILLKGPPGTGKSMLAGVFASSLGVPVIKLSIADIKGEVIGASGVNVRRLWEQARQQQPAIIFVDECEGAFVTRGADQGDSFSNEIVQAFLTEWDGIGGDQRILVIGASNRPELLDPAVMSRFTDVVELTPPKAGARQALVASVAKQLGIGGEIPEAASRLMDGLSGREVRNILQHAQRLAMPAVPSLKHYEEATAKVRGKSTTRTDEKASWETLILPAATKQRLRAMCQMVKESEELASKGIPVPKSLLLFGPPGTGKTQIARTFANESGLGFVARSTADLKGQYLGHAAARIAQAFEAARSVSPCILFIDEIDALTSSRSGDGQDQLQMEALTQLLQELDGIAARDGHVFVVAATNRLISMDAAILSRFSQKLEIGLPNQDARREILRTLLDGRPVAGDVDIDALTKRTEGFSGRDLRELIATGFNRAVERTIAEGLSAKESRLMAGDVGVS
jgi:transitional endoplasmic reticulum ATPase